MYWILLPLQLSKLWAICSCFLHKLHKFVRICRHSCSLPPIKGHQWGRCSPGRAKQAREVPGPWSMPHLHTCGYRDSRSLWARNLIVPERTRLLPQTGDWRSQIFQLTATMPVRCSATGECSRSDGIHGEYHLPLLTTSHNLVFFLGDICLPSTWLVILTIIIMHAPQIIIII